MKINKKIILFGLFLVLGQPLIFAGQFLKVGQELLEKKDGSKIFTSYVDEAQKQLEDLQLLHKEFKGKEKEFIKKITVEINEVSQKITIVEDELKQKKNEEFLTNKLSLLREKYQLLKTIKQAHKDFDTLIVELIKVIQEYLKDSNLKAFVKEYRDKGKLFYKFTDLQILNKMLFDQVKSVEVLEEQVKNAKIEFDNRKRTLSAAQELLKKRQDQFKQFVETPDSVAPESMFGFDIPQKTELFQLLNSLQEKKGTLASFQLKETERKASLVKFKLFIAKLQRDILKNTVRRVKPLIRIKEEDIVSSRLQLKKEKQASFIIKDRYRKNVDKLSDNLIKVIAELELAAKKYNIDIDKKLDEWRFEPKQTIGSYIGLSLVGDINAQKLLIERKKDFHEASLALEDEKINYQELEIAIKNIFLGIANRLYKSEEEINKQIRKYDAPEAELQATISRFKEKRNTLNELLAVQKRARDNCKKLINDLTDKKTTLFGKSPKEYAYCLNLLNSAQMRIQQQIDVIGKVISVYQDIITTSTNGSKQISFIVGELEAIGIWYRPEYAIKWEEVKNVLPDINYFFADIYSYFTSLSLPTIVQKIKYSFSDFFVLFVLLVKMLALCLGLAFYRVYLGKKIIVGLEFIHYYPGLKAISLIAQIFVESISRYFISFSLWLLICSFFVFGFVIDHHLYILLYMFSIFYLIYFVNRFISLFAHINKENDYVIISKTFENRFLLIISSVAYSTIAIQLFRQAFILSTYHKSELPEILLALNFIILQIALIFFISKEHILSILPDNKNIWKTINNQIDRFYYLILGFVIAVIVMINPYVGFGRLVLYVLSRIVYSALFMWLLYWVHDVVKRGSSHIFFAIEQDLAKERFSSSKTWYGLFVILSFLFLIGVGFIVGAQIWGWPITFKTILEWLRTTLFVGDEARPITIISLMQLLSFCIAGFLAAFAFNKFVLNRIFELLVVDIGMQNTVSSILRYLIISTIAVIGFQNIGLGKLVTYIIATVVLGLGFVIKDPLGDFIAYFLLLMQRPVKIGDFVSVDDKIMGVIKKITPRSTIIRAKNSHTIVVPNTKILKDPLFNWNYVSGFVAVDDIEVTVPYEADPAKVREVLRTVATDHPDTLKNPQTIVRLLDFADHGFVFMVRTFVSSHLTLDKWDIASDVRISIVNKLREHDIDIAIPTRILIDRQKAVKKINQSFVEDIKKLDDKKK